MLELTVRLVCSLALVVGLLLLIAKFAGKRFHSRTGATVQVVHRQPLSRGSAVAVVTVGTRVLVLGTTEHQVTLLTEVEPDEVGIDLADDLSLVEPGERQRAGVETDAPGLDTASPGGSAGSTSGWDAAPAEGPLSGSVLSPQTWKQAFSAATRFRSAS